MLELNSKQLMELEEKLCREFEQRLGEILSLLNRKKRLENFLELIGLESLIFCNNTYETFKSGIIVVIGASQVKENHLLAIAKKLGISRDRFEFYFEYKDIQKLNVSNFRYNLDYSLIMVGPMPHSGHGKEDSSSIISNMETKEGYPPVIRLGSNNLKISKSDFKNKLQESIDKGQIVVNNKLDKEKKIC